jgi:hypothetical protein
MTRLENSGNVRPAKHHDLLTPADNYWSFSDIGWQRRLGLQGRILGFSAAEILHNAMLADPSPRDIDTVIFPYAQCWRQPPTSSFS